MLHLEFDDQGYKDGEVTTGALIQTSNQSSFILHLGDIACTFLFTVPYSPLIAPIFIKADADNTATQDAYESVWNDYMNRLQPAVAVRPYMVLPGNHEVTCSQVPS